MIRVEFSGVGLLVLKAKRARFLALDVKRAGGRRHHPMLVIEEHAELGGAPPDFVITMPGSSRPHGVWRLQGAVLELTPGITAGGVKTRLNAVVPKIPASKINNPNEWRSLRRLPDMNEVALPSSKSVSESYRAARVTMNSGTLEGRMPDQNRRSTYNFVDGGQPVFSPDRHLTGQCVWTFDPPQDTHEIVVKRDGYPRRRIIVGARCAMTVSNECMSAPAVRRRGTPGSDLEYAYRFVKAGRKPRLTTMSGSGFVPMEYPNNINCGMFFMEI